MSSSKLKESPPKCVLGTSMGSIPKGWGLCLHCCMYVFQPTEIYLRHAPCPMCRGHVDREKKVGRSGSVRSRKLQCPLRSEAARVRSAFQSLTGFNERNHMKVRSTETALDVGLRFTFYKDGRPSGHTNRYVRCTSVDETYYGVLACIYAAYLRASSNRKDKHAVWEKWVSQVSGPVVLKDLFQYWKSRVESQASQAFDIPRPDALD